MGTTRKTIDTIINLKKGDDSGIKVLEKTEQAVESARKQVDTFQKKGGLAAIAVGVDNIEKVRTQIEAMALDLLGVEDAAAKARVELVRAAEGSDEWKKAASTLASSEARAASLRAELGRLPTELRESVRTSVGFLGDLDTGLQQIAGTLTGVGGTIRSVTAGLGVTRAGGFLSGLAQPIAFVGDLIALQEQLPIMSAAIREADLAARVLATGEVAAAGATGTLSGGIAAMTTSMVTMLGPIALVVGAIVVVTAIFGKLQQNTDDAIESLRELQQAQEKAIEFSRTATEREADIRRAEVAATLEFHEGELARLEARKDIIEDELNALDPIAAITSNLGEETVTLFEAIDHEIEAIRKTRIELDSLGEARVEENVAINTEIAAILSARDIREDTAQDVLRFTSEQAREEIAANRSTQESIRQTIGELRELGTALALEEIIELESEFAELQAREEALTATIIPLVAARERETTAIEATTEAMEERAIAAREREEAAIENLATATSDLIDDRVAAVKEEIAVEDKLITARKQEIKLGEDLVAISKRASAARAKVADDIAAIPKKLATDITAVNTAFMENALKAQTAFVKDERRIAEDADTARLQRLQDGMAQMQQAEEDNDVIAFIRAQRATEQDVARMDEGRNTEAARRADDRRAVVAEERAARDRRIAEINNEAKEAVNTNLLKLVEIQRQEQEALTARQAAHEKLLTEQATAEERRLEVERRLEEARTGIIIEGNRQVVNAIVGMAGAAANSIQVGAANLVSGLNNLFAQARASSVGRSPQPPVRSGSNIVSPFRRGGGGLIPTRRSLATAGIATGPTDARIGDRPDGLPEAVIPIPRDLVSRLASGEGFGGKQITVNLNGDIGDGVSEVQVEGMLNRVAVTIVDAFPA